MVSASCGPASALQALIVQSSSCYLAMLQGTRLPALAATPLAATAAAAVVPQLASLHCQARSSSSTGATESIVHILRQPRNLPSLPAASAAQQLVCLRGFSTGSGRPPQLQAVHSTAQRAASILLERQPCTAAQSSAPYIPATLPAQNHGQHWQGQLRRQLWQGQQQQPWIGLRGLHSSSSQAGLGVVDKLHDEVAIILPTEGHSRHFWEVLEFRPDSTVVETWKTPDVLGLHPRDVYLFASDVGIGQRAMLAARSGAILFRTDVCKAVVYHDRAVLFPCRRLPDTIRISQSVKAAVAQKSALPFELKVLEALLSETSRAYANKSKRLSIVAETVLTDINTNFHSSAGELQRLIPIQRKLTEVQNDVQEVLETISDAVNDDLAVKKLCLTERHLRSAPAAATAAARPGEGNPAPQKPAQEVGKDGRTPEMRAVSTILESYEFKLQGTHTSLKEALENIDQTRTVWHMQLDHQRNRVLRINLLISIMSLGGVMATLPAAYFGMNLSSGLEELPGVFWPMVQSSLVFGVLAAGGMWAYYKVGPKRRYRARLRDMRSLRDLLIYHLDDLDDVLQQVKERARKGTAVSRKDFGAIVQQAVKGKPMSQEEVQLLFRVFDTNKEGFLELSEMVRIEEKLEDEFSRTHLL